MQDFKAGKAESGMPDHTPVFTASRAVIDAVDQSKLGLFYARKTPLEGSKADEEKKDMDTKKDALLEAFKAQGTVLNAILVSHTSLLDISVSEAGHMDSPIQFVKTKT